MGNGADTWNTAKCFISIYSICRIRQGKARLATHGSAINLSVSLIIRFGSAMSAVVSIRVLTEGHFSGLPIYSSNNYSNS